MDLAERFGYETEEKVRERSRKSKKKTESSNNKQVEYSLQFERSIFVVFLLHSRKLLKG
jgi:hypothetical protein